MILDVPENGVGYPVNLNVRLSLQLLEDLRDVAERHDCTLSEAARLALDVGLQELGSEVKLTSPTPLDGPDAS